MGGMVHGRRHFASCMPLWRSRIKHLYAIQRDRSARAGRGLLRSQEQRPWTRPKRQASFVKITLKLLAGMSTASTKLNPLAAASD